MMKSTSHDLKELSDIKSQILNNSDPEFGNKDEQLKEHSTKRTRIIVFMFFFFIFFNFFLVPPQMLPTTLMYTGVTTIIYILEVYSGRIDVVRKLKRGNWVSGKVYKVSRFLRPKFYSLYWILIWPFYRFPIVQFLINQAVLSDSSIEKLSQLNNIMFENNPKDDYVRYNEYAEVYYDREFIYFKYIKSDHLCEDFISI